MLLAFRSKAPARVIARVPARPAIERKLALAALAALSVSRFAAVASAQTSTWNTTSSVNALWSAPANWDTVPGATTTAVQFFANTGVAFDAGATITASNDLTGQALNSLTINGVGPATGGAATLNVTGNSLTFTGANASITINTAYGSGAGATINLNTPLNLTANTTLTYSGGGANINLAGGFSGSGNLTFIGNLNNRPFQPSVAAPNYTGNVTIQRGIFLYNQTQNLLGTSANQTITMVGGTVLQANNWNGSANILQSLAINGTGTGSGVLNIAGINFGSNQIGALIVQSDSTINISRNAGAGATVYTTTVNRGLLGSGNLIKNGDIDLVLPAAAGNSPYTGNLTINSGRITANGGGGNGANILGNGNSGAQTVTINANAALAFNQGSGSYSQPQNFNVNSTGTFGTSGGLVFTGINFGSPSIGSLGSDTGGTVRFDVDGAQAVGSRSVFATRGLFGAGRITKNGTATLVVNAAGSFTGDLAVGSGIVQIGAVANILGANTAGTQTVTVAPSGQIVLEQGSGAYNQPQIFLVNGTGTGTTTGALVVNNLANGSMAIGGLNVQSNATINLNFTGGSVRSVGVTAPLAGSGTLTKIGNATFAPQAGNATFSGNINLNAGVIALPGANNALGASSSQTVTVSGNTAVQANWNGSYAAPQTFAINGTGTGTTTGALALTAINFGNATIGGLNVVSNATVNFAYAGTDVRVVNVTNPLAGTGTLTKIGNAVMATLGASATFTGNVNVNEGQLELAGVINPLGANASGTQTVTLAGGTGVNFNGTGAAPQNFSITGNGAAIGNSVAALSQFNGGNYTIGSVTLTGDASISSAGTLTVAGVVSGSNTLTKIGSGTLFIGGSNPSPFTGNVNVNAGTLQINVSGSLGTTASSVTVAPGANVIATNLFSQRIYSQLFTISGNGPTGGGAISFTGMDNFGGNTTLGGLNIAADASVSFARNGNQTNNPNTGVRVLTALAGSGTLTKNGDAALYLTTGAAPFTGNVNVNAGVLELASVSNALGGNGSNNQSVNVASGAGVNFAGSGSAPQSFSVSGSGTGTNNSTGALSQYGAGTYNIGAVTLASDATVSATTGTLNITGTLNGSGSLTKAGSGTVTLSGNVSTTGNVNVGAGTLLTQTPLRPVTGSLVVTGPGANLTLAAPGSTGYVASGSFASISVSGGGSVSVPVDPGRFSNAARVVVTGGLSLSGGSLFDLGDADLIVRNATASDIASLVAAGSLRASATSPAGYTTLAVFSNDGGGVPFYSNYDGTSVGTGDVIVKTTFVGDTNLDGVLDGTDLGNVLEGLSTPGATGWASGDLDYSGTVTLADLGLFNAAYDYYRSNPLTRPVFGGGQAVGSAVTGAVPEPASLGLLLAAVPMATRRRRK